MSADADRESAAWSRAGAVVLVEGESDAAALETLARKQGRDLGADGVVVLRLGGATNVVRVLRDLRDAAYDGTVAGLVDVAEARWFRAGLQQAGWGRVRDDEDLADLGVYTCVEDLEDELVRALGVGAAQAVVEQQGELASLRTLQHQPAQRRRTPEQQLHRFLGTRAGRKALYARLLVEALPLDRVPAPLLAVLSRV